RAPPDYVGGHPVQVEVDALDEAVAGGDRDRSITFPPGGGVVLAGGDQHVPARRGEMGQQPFQQPQLAELAQRRQAVRAAKAARAAASGSSESKSPRIMQARVIPAATSCVALSVVTSPIVKPGCLIASFTLAKSTGPLTVMAYS